MSDDEVGCRELRCSCDPMVVFHGPGEAIETEWIRLHESELVEVRR